MLVFAGIARFAIATLVVAWLFGVALRVIEPRFFEEHPTRTGTILWAIAAGVALIDAILWMRRHKWRA